jgi:hypothetical protein
MKIIRECSRTIDTPLQRFVVQQHKVAVTPPWLAEVHPFVPPIHDEESSAARAIRLFSFVFWKRKSTKLFRNNINNKFVFMKTYHTYLPWPGFHFFWSIYTICIKRIATSRIYSIATQIALICTNRADASYFNSKSRYTNIL